MSASSIAPELPASPSASKLATSRGSLIESIPPVEVFVPGLTDRTLFGPLPSNDALVGLLTRNFSAEQRPARESKAQWQNRSVSDMASRRHWRALASYAQDAIMRSKPEATAHILTLWCLRCQALQLLRAPSLLFHELQGVFRLLPAPYPSPIPPRSASPQPFFLPAIPFELLVFRARIHALLNRPDVTLELLYELSEGCKRELEATQRPLWAERAEVMSRLIASTLIDMREYAHAADILSNLGRNSTAALVHLRSGNLLAAQEVLSRTDEVPLQTQIAAEVAKGDFEAAERLARAAIATPKDGAAINNLAVILLYRSKLPEAAQLLTQLIANQPMATFNAEPILANLAICIELLPQPPEGTQAWTKMSLLAEASRWTGEGLSPSTFKL